MKKTTSISLLILGVIGLSSFIYFEFSSANTEDVKEQNNDIIGEFTLEEFKATSHKKWYEDRYEAYQLNPDVVEKASSVIDDNNFRITVYMGTWCEDSQREFPVLIKFLNHIDYEFKNLRLVGVNEDKVVPNLTEEKRKKLNVFNVPTIIVYNQEGKELNRFVEFPQETLEKDMLKILSGEDYNHVYDF